MSSLQADRPIASVLIVDDSTVQRSHAASLCRELGVGRIDEAGDGEEALALLESLPSPPALLIIDLAMPRMDGIELIEELHRRGNQVPIALASASGDSLMETVQGMHSSVAIVLRKPLNLDSLRNALNRHAPVLRSTPERRQAGRMPFDTVMLGAAVADGTIRPHFQPKVDMASLEMRGVEALARWQHPTLGPIPPDQFIPMAEREGLIHGLTLAILDQALAHCAAWQRAGRSLSVAVNLSPQLLVHAEIVREVCDLTERHGVRPSQVVLELTEGWLVEPASPALGVLARLRLKGFGLSIDDYGTGFSSMQQLARVPFTELKVDRSFVHGAHGRKGLRTILKSALDLARHLGLATVAEGIELVEDLRLLQDFGCTTGQGWLIARPMPGEDILAWLNDPPQRLSGWKIPTEQTP